jgi:ribonuclease D
MNKTFPPFISKEEINELPMVDCFGKFELIETEAQLEEAIRVLSAADALGFDTETRPSFSKGEVYQVSMLQLATDEVAFLIRLNRVQLSEGLRAVLSNPSIVKSGVAIHDDIKALQKLGSFEPGGFIDVAIEAKKKGFTSLGLRAITAIFLGKRLSKAAKVTNWDRSQLSESQLKYAANDAFAGLHIYREMKDSQFLI